MHSDGATTRERLLDAATDAVRAGTSWHQLRMADVARIAGVSRQTLYYEFGSRDALAQAVALREAERYAAGAAAATDEALAADDRTTPGQALGAGVEFTLREAAANPLLKAVLIDDTGGLLPYLTTRAQALLAVVDERAAARLSERWPDVDPARVQLVADAVNRLTLSHLVSPGGRPDEVAADVRVLVDALLVPVPSVPVPSVPASPGGTS